jgi:hypothetical protein
LSQKEGVKRRALGVEELLKRHRVGEHVEGFLELPGRQNEGSNTDEWVIARRDESRDVTSSHFAALIGDGPLDVLEVLSFNPYFNCSVEWQGTQGGKYCEVRHGDCLLHDWFHYSLHVNQLVSQSTRLGGISKEHGWVTYSNNTRAPVKGAIRGLGSCVKIYKADTTDKIGTGIITSIQVW